MPDLTPDFILQQPTRDAGLAPIILIVPNVVLPPRVPKLLTAIAFKLPIVGFSWILEKYKSKNSPNEVNLKAH